MSAGRALGFAAVFTGFALAGFEITYADPSPDNSSPKELIAPPAPLPVRLPVPPFDNDFVLQNARNDYFSYAANQGKNLLYIRNKDVTNFYTGRWHDAAKQTTTLISEIDFETLEETRQAKYFQNMKILHGQLPKECGVTMKNCTVSEQYLKTLYQFNASYKASAHLRIWQVQHIERAYIAALMDPEIGAAARNWGNLTREKKIEIGRKLLTYQASAYNDVTLGRTPPEIKVFAFDAGDDTFMYSEYGKNHILVNELKFDHLSAGKVFSLLWHEGHHIIINNMADTVNKDLGAYVEKYRLLTEMKIIALNGYLYSNVIDQSGTYVFQAAESSVRIDEAFGAAVGIRLLDPSTLHQISEEQARKYFYDDLNKAVLEYENINPSFILQNDAIHAVFLKQWLAGGEICFPNTEQIYFCESQKGKEHVVPFIEPNFAAAGRVTLLPPAAQRTSQRRPQKPVEYSR